MRWWLAAIATLALAAPAGAHPGETARAARAAAVDQPCPGAKIAPAQVITGSFPSAIEGSYVMVPFTVPDGTTSVRVKYCFESTDSPASARVNHTIDLGLWDARGDKRTWTEADFRGWGGSSHPDVTVSPQGFSSEAEYLKAPKGHVPGRTTRGFVPGPVPDGQWAVELGAMAIVSRELGDSDGAVGYRVEIELSTDPAHAADRYRPAAYSTAPAKRGPGWYAGDFHVHAEHSALGDATMRETFGYAFKEAKLDFITLSDYVTTSGWGEIGRHQGDHPGKLIARSNEVITPKGHLNNHVSRRYVDHRTGPVYERKPDGSLLQIRAPQGPNRILSRVKASLGFTQLNHPTIFPSSVPGFSYLCRGCPWDHAATDYAKVDAVEVATGPAGVQDSGDRLAGPNPFTVLAVDFYERALATGNHIAAVGSSDSHNAGRRNDPVLQAPIGQATTMVHANVLSEDGIRCGVERAHTYVKVWGADSPDLRFEGKVPGVARTAIFGDTIRGAATLTATVVEPEEGMVLQVTRDGAPFIATDRTVTFAAGPGRYRLQLMKGASIFAISSPIWVEEGAAAVVEQPCAKRKRPKPKRKRS